MNTPETAAKEELKKPSACPFCGMELTKPGPGTNWRHAPNALCFIAGLHGSVIDNDLIDDWNRRASPWRPIAEAKQDATPRLLWHWGFPAYVGYYSLGLGWVSDGRRVYPTHFAPLPEPPEVQS